MNLAVFWSGGAMDQGRNGGPMVAISNIIESIRGVGQCSRSFQDLRCHEDGLRNGPINKRYLWINQ